jgi:hypothetical protein
MNLPESLDPPVFSFRVPVFNRGRNTTVRRGDKWHAVMQARLQPKWRVHPASGVPGLRCKFHGAGWFHQPGIKPSCSVG